MILITKGYDNSKGPHSRAGFSLVIFKMTTERSEGHMKKRDLSGGAWEMMEKKNTLIFVFMVDPWIYKPMVCAHSNF